jgi:hypothetical protein
VSALDGLPADQRAVLQLVLGQGRSYDELAALLKITPEAVQDRAHAGALALASPAGADVAPGVRGAVVDYLLGQQGVSERAPTRRALATDAPARAWAAALAEQLRPLARAPLPELPEPAPPAGAGEPAPPSAPARGGEPPPTPPRASRPRRSLVGGAVLLAAVAAVVAVLVVVLTKNGGGDNGTSASANTSSAPASASTTPTSSTPTSTTGPSVIGQANLTPVASGSRALGVAQLLSQGTSAGFLIRVERIAISPHTYLGVWLTSARGASRFLGAVLNKDVKRASFTRLAPVPGNVRSYNRMVISREPVRSSKKAPAKPTTVVMSGPLKLAGSG